MKRILKSLKTILGLLSIGLGYPFSSYAACSQLSGDMSAQAISDRMTGPAWVEVEASGGSAPAAEPQKLSANVGETRYKSTCAVCHDAGIAGAPKFRNAADWQPRMGAGIEAMLKIAIQGKGAMPPRGTCMQCSDEELQKAIEYMLPKS